jgi:cyanate permease
MLAFTAVAVLGLLAAAGPSLFGVLHDATDAWTIPLGLHLAITLCLMIDIINEINT